MFETCFPLRVVPAAIKDDLDDNSSSSSSNNNKTMIWRREESYLHHWFGLSANEFLGWDIVNTQNERKHS
jgi:hypothetical protein